MSAMPPAERTSRISSVAYATEDSASLANTGSAIFFGSSCSPSWALRIGRPTSSRLETSPSEDTATGYGQVPAGIVTPRACRDHGLRARRLDDRAQPGALRPLRRRRRPKRRGVPPARSRLRRAHRDGCRLRPRHPDRGRHRGGRRLRRRLQRRQLQHHLGAGRSGDLRRRQRRGAHLRPETRRGLHPTRHPHRRDGPLDGGRDASAIAAGRRAQPVERPERTHPAHRSDVRRQLGRSIDPQDRGPRRSARRVPDAFRRRDARHLLDGAAGRRPAARARRAWRRRPDRAGPHQHAAGTRMRVAIAGAGNVGRSIARELTDNGHQVLLIEREPRALKTASVAAAQWLLADACELASLEEARIQDCQVMVAATGDDKVNLVVSLLAKTEYGVPRVVARINHPKNEWLFNEAWGVDVAVSTPRLLSALVEEAVTVGDLVRLLRFSQGDANLVELTLPEEAVLVGTRVGDVEWPTDTSLVTIIRGNRVLTPSKDDALEAGDELLFVAAPHREEQLEDLLSVRDGAASGEE